MWPGWVQRLQRRLRGAGPSTDDAAPPPAPAHGAAGPGRLDWRSIGPMPTSASASSPTTVGRLASSLQRQYDLPRGLAPLTHGVSRLAHAGTVSGLLTAARRPGDVATTRLDLRPGPPRASTLPVRPTHRRDQSAADGGSAWPEAHAPGTMPVARAPDGAQTSAPSIPRAGDPATGDVQPGEDAPQRLPDGRLDETSSTQPAEPAGRARSTGSVQPAATADPGPGVPARTVARQQAPDRVSATEPTRDYQPLHDAGGRRVDPAASEAPGPSRTPNPSHDLPLVSRAAIGHHQEVVAPGLDRGAAATPAPRVLRAQPPAPALARAARPRHLPLRVLSVGPTASAAGGRRHLDHGDVGPSLAERPTDLPAGGAQVAGAAVPAAGDVPPVTGVLVQRTASPPPMDLPDLDPAHASAGQDDAESEADAEPVDTTAPATAPPATTSTVRPPVGLGRPLSAVPPTAGRLADAAIVGGPGHSRFTAGRDAAMAAGVQRLIGPPVVARAAPPRPPANVPVPHGPPVRARPMPGRSSGMASGATAAASPDEAPLTSLVPMLAGRSATLLRLDGTAPSPAPPVQRGAGGTGPIGTRTDGLGTRLQSAVEGAAPPRPRGPTLGAPDPATTSSPRRATESWQSGATRGQDPITTHVPAAPPQGHDPVDDQDGASAGAIGPDTALPWPAKGGELGHRTLAVPVQRAADNRPPRGEMRTLAPAMTTGHQGIARQLDATAASTPPARRLRTGPSVPRPGPGSSGRTPSPRGAGHASILRSPSAMPIAPAHPSSGGGNDPRPGPSGDSPSVESELPTSPAAAAAAAPFGAGPGDRTGNGSGAVQRSMQDAAPTGADAPAGGAPPPGPDAQAETAAAVDTAALFDELYPRVRDELRWELRVQRERAGLLADPQ